MTTTPKSILLTTLPVGSRFFTTLTMKPGIYLGAYNFGGLTVKWENTGEVAHVHRNLLVIPDAWDNLDKDRLSLRYTHKLRVVDAPGADYSVA